MWRRIPAIVCEVPDEIAYLSFVSDKAAELSELFANGEIREE